MLDLPLPDLWSPEEPWHITGDNELPRLRRRHIRSHRSIDQRAVVLVHGIRCTHPLVTWADLAGTLRLEDLVIMGDAMVRPNRHLTMSDLRAHVATRARHRGVVRMREALSLLRVGSGSPMETTARLLSCERVFRNRSSTRRSSTQPENGWPSAISSGGSARSSPSSTATTTGPTDVSGRSTWDDGSPYRRLAGPTSNSQHGWRPFPHTPIGSSTDCATSCSDPPRGQDRPFSAPQNDQSWPLGRAGRAGVRG
jgi:hypothetical protein